MLVRGDKDRRCDAIARGLAAFAAAARGDEPSVCLLCWRVGGLV